MVALDSQHTRLERLDSTAGALSAQMDLAEREVQCTCKRKRRGCDDRDCDHDSQR